MTRRDWLLIFAAYRGAPDGLDPIRFQKGLFLFSMAASVPQPEKYQFKPHDYGPMSPGIYRDLDTLVSEGLLAEHPVPGKRWSRYRPTESGLRAAKRLLTIAAAEGRHEATVTLYELKRDVSKVGFNELLERVYDEYPEYAVNSVFSRHG